MDLDAKILVVEDDPVTSKALACTLKTEGYQVATAADAREARHAAKEMRPDLLVLDLTLLNDSALNGLVDGFGLLRWLRYTLSGDIQFHVIVYTVDSSPQVDKQAKAWQVFAVIRKTETPQVLLSAIRQAFAAGKPKFSWIEAPTW